MGGLRQKALDAAGAVHGLPVLVAQLVHAEDGDDVLQFLIFLQRLLHPPGDAVMLRAHNVRLQNPGGGFQRVHGGVNALLGDLPAQHRGGVQMGKGGGGGGVGQIVGGHIDRLYRGDGAVLRGSDALL